MPLKWELDHHGARETGRNERRVLGGVPDALGPHPLLAVFASALKGAHRTEEIPDEHSALLRVVPERDPGVHTGVPDDADARTPLPVVERGELKTALEVA